MPKEKETASVRQGRELVKQSNQLCDVSRQRINRGKHLREDVVERTEAGRRASQARGWELRSIAMTASSAELVAKADASAIRFITTELETGLSYARMARRLREAKKVRPGNIEKARRYLQYARTAYEAASSRLGTVKTKPEQLREIDLKMSELVELLRTDERPESLS